MFLLQIFLADKESLEICYLQIATDRRESEKRTEKKSLKKRKEKSGLYTG